MIRRNDRVAYGTDLLNRQTKYLTGSNPVFSALESSPNGMAIVLKTIVGKLR